MSTLLVINRYVCSSPVKCTNVCKQLRFIKMADYWKSNERKYCDFCQCWLSDNKASISFHENGKRHKMNVAKRLSDISRNSEKSERERQKMDAEMRKIEDAAMRSYALDIHARGDMTAKTVGAVMAASTDVTPTTSGTASSSSRPRQIDPLRLPGNSDDEDDCRRVTVAKVDPEAVPNASLWVEGKSDDGYTYYWNVKTNESVWEAPKEGFLTWQEYQKINELAIKQQEVQQAAEAKRFRENVNEEVARYNREKLKTFRKQETPAEKQAKQEEVQNYKTEADVNAGQMGAWQTVEHKPPPEQIDWQLPKTNNYAYVPPAIVETPLEPPLKRFKEKTIEGLDDETIANTSCSFKKRKFAGRGNARTRLNDD